MFRFSLDMLISNLVDFSVCMTLNFGDKLRAQKKILSAVAGRRTVIAGRRTVSPCLVSVADSGGPFGKA